MRRRVSLKVIGGVCLIVMLGLTPIMVEGKVITLKAVCHSTLEDAQTAGFLMFAKKVNEELKGELVIEVRGGPDVIPPFELHEAARGGAIDIASTSCSYYSPLVKGVSEAVMFTNLLEEELVANKVYYDLMVKVHEKIGLRYLGDSMPYVKFFIFTNKKVKTNKDFVGQKIRLFKAIIPFIKALGAAPITMPVGEIYTSMERGVIDGYVKDVQGVINERHYDEVTKYVVDHGFYRGTLNILMNLNRWNSLPAHLQEKIVKIRTDLNPELLQYAGKRYKDDWQLIRKSRIEVIKFSVADEKAFLNLAYESGWSTVTKTDPQLGPELKKALLK